MYVSGVVILRENVTRRSGIYTTVNMKVLLPQILV